ncbi:MAG TPA: AbrB/MazE/SpoVT family DNA-binding domain-containing protein [Candidatus Angelobacter sp.]|nr:AbrB/MazE/SpoVT family DNA-binding domain-containing protein [Candidatus Angelobacter sp.]
MAEILVSKEILECLRKDNGSDFSAIETPDGYLVKVNNPEVERQLNAALKIMDEYEETLRILAK